MTCRIDDLPPRQIFTAICADFETAWDAVAHLPEAEGLGRGNFAFALQSMVFLEWICRLCDADSKGEALPAFASALNVIRPEYFRAVPLKLDPSRSLKLPNAPRADMPESHQPLLWLLFDLVRNGLGHQYQQIVVRADHGDIYVSLAGAAHGKTLHMAEVHREGEARHLRTAWNECALSIDVYPQWLFLDFRGAFWKANLLDRGLEPVRFVRFGNGSYRDLTVAKLAAALHRSE